ncbi:MAG: gliding motility protein GldM [Flavobacteriales bacterium]|nr:gliding motility protein GldM [Flavobacteriales bacterium]
MAGNNLSPRQKMIGMMYLVLTAMLALNVSKEVLDAFQKINGGIVKTTQNFNSKNDEVYSAFVSAAETNETKAGPWRDKAFSVKEKADKLNDDIQRLKFDMVMLADKQVTFEGKEPIENITYDDLSAAQKKMLMVDVISKKDRERPGELMINKGNGEILQKALEEYRDYLKELVDEPTIQSSLSTTFTFEDKKEKYGSGMLSWVQQNFQDMPLIAAVTILSKIQTDVRNAESDVIKYLQQEIDAGSLKFTSADAIQIATSNYVFLGDSFKADVFLAAKDTTQNPLIYVGDYEVDEDGKYKMVGNYDSIPVVSGKGKYAVKANSEGYKKWGGLISMKTDAGTKLYPFNGEYQVAKASLVVSPTKMNVFYILASYPLKEDALGNPIDVSVPGVPKDKLSVSCDNGTVKKVGAGWEVFPKTTGKAKISVTAEIDGKKRNMGSLEYRVMRTPKPEPKFLGSKNKKVKKSQLLSSNAKLYAELSNFVFDIKYRITGFSVDVTQRGELVTKFAKGNKVTPEMKSLFESLQVGSVLYFTNITCKGPDGAPKSLPALKLTIN